MGSTLPLKQPFVLQSKDRGCFRSPGGILLVGNGDVHGIQLDLVHSSGSVHHQVLRILVHGEGNDLTDALPAAQQHHHPVDAGGCACVGRCAVGEGIVHSRELGLHILFAQANHLEGLDHNFGIVVTDSAGGGFVAVDNQVILIGVDSQQFFGITLCIQQGLHTALGHGEGVVAEFQLAGFLAHRVHGEVHDPAHGVLLLVEVAGDPSAQQGTDDTRGLLGGNLLAGGHAHEAAGLQAELFGKLACIGDDIGDEFIPNPASFKKLTSGDRLTVEKKGQDPFDFNSYAKLLFSANNIPRIKDKSGAVQSRLIIIPFNATFSKDDPDYDPYIKYKLRSSDSMEYLIQIGIAGLKRVLGNQEFTTSKKVQKELEEYEENNNPILLFFKENPKIENEPTKHVYKKYAEFCIANSLQAMSNIEFSKQIKKRYGLDIIVKSINGKQHRIFVKKEGE